MTFLEGIPAACEKKVGLDGRALGSLHEVETSGLPGNTVRRGVLDLAGGCGRGRPERQGYSFLTDLLTAARTQLSLVS